MTVAVIHRLLCTHCTFGTSELETHSADNAAKVLGYSVRKSSLPDSERGQLRQVFRAVERLLSYSLPRDATAAQKETLSADLAPRRLIFMPNLGGWQVAGQVAYRAHDTAGRPGSYFADLLVSKAPDPRNRDAAAPWSAKDVLQLWSVGHDRKPSAKPDWWVSSEEQLTLLEAEENARNPESEACWKPAAPERIDDLRDSRPALLDDATVFRFLTAQTGDDGTSTDPFIPPRWWAVPTAVRQELVAAVLHATLLGPARGGRETVTLAVEPSVAAVVFYAVCRLLPGRISGSLSFSTYEPAPDRPLTGFVATTCLNEAADSADLPTDLTHRAFACDTFRNPTQFGRGQAPSERSYARYVVGQAAANAWREIDGFLATLDLDGVTAGDLDRLLEIERIVTAYLHGSGPGGDARRTPLETQFLRRRFQAGIEARLEIQAPWPDDLLGVALAWFGDDFEQLWTESDSIRHLFARYLPRDTKGLAQMLASSGKGPRVPMCVRAAAVIAAMTADPQYLPDAFINYCKDACHSAARPEATMLVRTVLSELPDLTALQHARCFELTDLILEGLRETPGLTAALPLADLLTESLASRKQSLENKADLLARHHSLAKHILLPDGRLQDAVSTVFAELLDMQTKDPGRHLVKSGRSRIRQLKDWLPPGHDFLGALNTWSRLHAGIERLAADAPPWRTWPQVKNPDATDTQPVAHLIAQLSPFDQFQRKTSLQRQQQLATGVVTALVTDEKKAETVRAWLAAALETNVRHYGPGRGRGQRRTPLWQWVAAGCLAMVVGGTIGLLAVGSREEPPHGTGDDPRPEEGVVKSGNREKATQKPSSQPMVPEIATQPKTASAPPTTPTTPRALTQSDIGLTIEPVNGNLRVSWNQDKVRAKENVTIQLKWKWPGATDFTPAGENPETLLRDGGATLNTADKGFGVYEAQFTVQSTAAGSPSPLLVSTRHEIPAPRFASVQPRLVVEAGKPLLVFDPMPTVETQLYGETQYLCDLHIGNEGKTVETLTRDGTHETLRLPIPLGVRPERFAEQPEPAASLRVKTRQGMATAVDQQLIALPKVSEEIQARLRRKRFQANAFPSQPPAAKDDVALVCELPGLLDEKLFDVWLMTPQSDKFGALALGKAVDGKVRWGCTFTPPPSKKTAPAGQNDDGPVTPITLGHFRVDSVAPGWEKELRFVAAPAMQRREDFMRGFDWLRCCRLCLVYESQPVATCQLMCEKNFGPLSLWFNIAYNYKAPPGSADLTLTSAQFLDTGAARFLAQDIGWWEVKCGKDMAGERTVAGEQARLVATVVKEEKKLNNIPRHILELRWEDGRVPDKEPVATAIMKVNADNHWLEVEPLKWPKPLQWKPHSTPDPKKGNTKGSKPRAPEESSWVTKGTAEEAYEAREREAQEAEVNERFQLGLIKTIKDERGREAALAQPRSAYRDAVAEKEQAEAALQDARSRKEVVDQIVTQPLVIPEWEVAWETKHDKQPVNDKIDGGTRVFMAKGSRGEKRDDIEFKSKP